jgi:hypothetical protein
MRLRFPSYLVLATLFSLTQSSFADAAGAPPQGPGATAIPRAPDGKPDLSGIWQPACVVTMPCWQESLFFDLAKDLPPSAVEMTPWAKGLADERERREHVDDPYGYCLPPGVPRINNIVAFKLVPTPKLTVVLYETSVGLMFRQVFTDGRPLPEVTEPTWLGYSVGRWDGDTFVVDSVGFRDGGWLDTRKARPHSSEMRLTERFRRRDFGHLELSMTIDDPRAFKKAWTTRTVMSLLPDTELIEAFCDGHEKTMEHRRIAAPPAEPPSPAPR